MLLNADVIALGRPVLLSPGHNAVVVQIEALHLNPGTYVVGLWAGDALAQTFDHLEEAFQIEVVALHEHGLGLTPKSNGIVPCGFDIQTPAAAGAHTHASEAQRFERA